MESQEMQNNNKNRRNMNNKNQTFDSNGPTGRIKGSTKQISDKYTSLARDAYASGDTVLMENYYQHAEHYFRVSNYLKNNYENRKKSFKNDKQETQEDVKVDKKIKEEVVNEEKVANQQKKEEVKAEKENKGLKVETQEDVQKVKPVKKLVRRKRILKSKIETQQEG